MHTLIQNVKVEQIATTTGGTTFLLTSGTDGAFVTAGEIDMQGYEAAMFVSHILNMPTSGGVVAVKLAGANTTGTTGVDLLGTLQTLTDTTGNLKGTVIVSNIYRPDFRFLNIVYQRTVSGVAMSFEVYKYNPRNMVVGQTSGFTTNIAGVAGAPGIYNWPSSGTA